MRASLVAQLGKNPPAMQETTVSSWGGKIRWRRVRLPTPAFLGCPGGSDGKESAHNVEDLGSIPGLGRSPGEGKGHPLQCSCLENSIVCIVHGVAKGPHKRGGEGAPRLSLGQPLPRDYPSPREKQCLPVVNGKCES